MKRILFLLICGALSLILPGCAAQNDGAETAEAAEEDLFKQWGPDVMPDRQTEPLQFFYWRIDRLFVDQDLDKDGKISRVEFDGEEYNFTRMDVNADGHLTKKEIIDDSAPEPLPGGESPS